MKNIVETPHKVILTIVNKGQGTRVVEISKRFGCEGGTILPGKGTGIRDSSFFGIQMTPEKDVVLSIVAEDCVDNVLNAICKAVKIRKKGNGISIVLGTKLTAGMAHLINDN